MSKRKKKKYRELPTTLPSEVNSYIFDQIVEVVPESIICKCFMLGHDAKRRLDSIIQSDEYRNADNKRLFLEKNLNMDNAKILEIERATVGQTENKRWFKERKYRLTASTFGNILQAINRDSYPPSLFKSLKGEYDLSKVDSIKWGKEHEPIALKNFSEKTGFQVEPSGLWVHRSGLLAASPDGLIDNDKIVEVKCPYTHRFLSISELLDAEKDNVKYFIQKNVDGRVVLNKEHAYWDQIQGQLLFTDRKICYFIVFLVREMLTVTVMRDSDWEKNVDRLIEFYLEQFVPKCSEI